MTPAERKAAFRHAADLERKTLNAAAYEACGVTWFHLAEAIAERRPLSADVKAKFAAYIGRSVDDVFAAGGGVATLDESGYTVEAVKGVDVLGSHEA